jgi:hypothetical protein
METINNHYRDRNWEVQAGSPKKNFEKGMIYI